MKCPICEKIEFKKLVFNEIEADYCPNCLGLWFEEDELRQAKDVKDKTLNWLDIDLWNDKTLFKVARGKKVCPKDGVPLYEVKYGTSEIKVDLCDQCHGIWLDRGEFKKIMEFLKKKGQDEILFNYLGTLAEEAGEVFTGPEGFKSEMRDLFVVLDLLKYKFLVQHPIISKAIEMLPK